MRKILKYTIAYKNTEGHIHRIFELIDNLMDHELIENKSYRLYFRDNIRTGITFKIRDDYELHIVPNKKGGVYDHVLDLRKESSGRHTIRGKIISKYGEEIVSKNNGEGYMTLNVTGTNSGWTKEMIQEFVDNGTIHEKYFYKTRRMNEYLSGLSVLRGDDSLDKDEYSVCLPTQELMDLYLYKLITKRLKTLEQEKLRLHPVNYGKEKEIYGMMRTVLEHQRASLKVSHFKIKMQDIKEKREENENTES